LHAVKQFRTQNTYLYKTILIDEPNVIGAHYLLVMLIGNVFSRLWLTKWRDVYIFRAEVNAINTDALL